MGSLHGRARMPRSKQSLRDSVLLMLAKPSIVHLHKSLLAFSCERKMFWRPTCRFCSGLLKVPSLLQSNGQLAWMQHFLSIWRRKFLPLLGKYTFYIFARSTMFCCCFSHYVCLVLLVVYIVMFQSLEKPQRAKRAMSCSVAPCAHTKSLSWGQIDCQR